MTRQRTSRSKHPLTRRDLLQRAGLAVSAAALTPAPVFARPLPPQEMPPAGEQTAADFPISERMIRLSTYMSQARDRALPDEVLERTKRHVLDTFAAIVSGAELLPGRVARDFARAYGGSNVATIVADTVLCGPIEAALVNGTAAHADETDDTLSGPWHPGSVVVPAALALGEQFNSTGTHFLRAVALGYDIGTRILAAVPGLGGRHLLSYGFGGVFGAAAAGASLAGLDADKMRWVLSYAAQQASGVESFPRDPDHIEKGFIFAGMPARSGVSAVLLVRNGFTAVHDIFAGPHNFLEAFAPNPRADELVEGLGQRYAMMNANIKRWTVGFPIQAVLDSIEALIARARFDPGQIQEIVLRYQPGSITDNSGPTDINVQHAVAVMLVDRTVTFRSIHDTSRLRDPAIVALRAKVRLVPGPGRGRGGDGAGTPIIQIALADGRRIEQDNIGASLGTAANPMSREQVVAKARELMGPVLGTQKTGRLIDRVMTLEQAGGVRELRPLLQAAPHDGPPRLSEYPSRS